MLSPSSEGLFYAQNNVQGVLLTMMSKLVPCVGQALAWQEKLLI